MDVQHINPFLAAFYNVMPQIGFQDVKRGNVSLKGKELRTDGVLIIVGIVGDLEGNVVYYMTMDDAKKVSSKMMMGMPVEELNEMAQSALCELSNMLTANASTEFSNNDIKISISTPTLIYGKNITAKLSTDQVICVEVFVDDIPIELNVSVM